MAPDRNNSCWTKPVSGGKKTLLKPDKQEVVQQKIIGKEKEISLWQLTHNSPPKYTVNNH